MTRAHGDWCHGLVGLFALFLIPLAFSASTPAPSTAQESAQEPARFVVIVNEENPTDALSAAMVSRFFLRKTTRWQGGTAVQPVDQPLDSPVRESFSRRVHGRSQWNINAYWQRKIFSGGGTPPPEEPDDAAVVAYVREHPGAIGYVSKKSDPQGVKVVTLTDLPKR